MRKNEDAKILIIIPAAGFGRRVGSPESKEMLQFSHSGPLIDLALSRCLSARERAKVHVITRAEKTTLIEHLSDWRDRLNLDVQIVEPTRDWPETVLASQKFWREWNIVLLPDIDFKPDTAFSEIIQYVSRPSVEADVVAAVHRVGADAEKWGYVHPYQAGVEVGEKPTMIKTNWAWGIYAFRRSIGEQLLKAQMDAFISREWRTVEARPFFLKLAEFKDLTRLE